MFTAWKMFVFGVILVRIFSHSDRIRRYTVYLSAFSPNVGKCGPEWLRIRTFFTQWLYLHFKMSKKLLCFILQSLFIVDCLESLSKNKSKQKFKVSFTVKEGLMPETLSLSFFVYFCHFIEKKNSAKFCSIVIIYHGVMKLNSFELDLSDINTTDVYKVSPLLFCIFLLVLDKPWRRTNFE